MLRLLSNRCNRRRYPRSVWQISTNQTTFKVRLVSSAHQSQRAAQNVTPRSRPDPVVSINDQRQGGLNYYDSATGKIYKFSRLYGAAVMSDSYSSRRGGLQLPLLSTPQKRRMTTSLKICGTFAFQFSLCINTSFCCPLALNQYTIFHLILEFSFG